METKEIGHSSYQIGSGGSARGKIMTPFMPERDLSADSLKVTLVCKQHV